MQQELRCIALKKKLLRLHLSICEAVRESIRKSKTSDLLSTRQGAGDVSYPIDVVAEKIINSFFENFSIDGGVIVVSEGIGRKVFPASISESEAKYVVVIDPIDGTREIMYDKRSAWILTGVALNRSKAVTLSDIEFALQTELPILKQDVASVVYAIKGQGAYEELWNIEKHCMLKAASRLHSSTATGLEHGYLMSVDPYADARRINSSVIDKVIEQVAGPAQDNEAIVFTDQYGSTGGQIYMLASGKYRLLLDMRPAIAETQKSVGKGSGLCCHPYDLCSYLIATEAGCVITNLDGSELCYPLDTSTDCGWIGYANKTIRKRIESVLLREIRMLSVSTLK